MAELVDSGERREFGTGSVRDKAEGKGRCDLLPLREVAELLDESPDGVLRNIDLFLWTGDTRFLRNAINDFVCTSFDNSITTAILEVAKQYEDGARKYSARNWEKGQPLHVYVDSAIRHYLRWFRGDDDEPHDRACLWNLLGAWWTINHLPHMNDLPYMKEEEPCQNSTTPTGEPCNPTSRFRSIET